MPPPPPPVPQRRDPRDDPDADVRAPEAPVLMEGPLRKQGARVQMWSQRYAVLQGPRLLMYRGTREEVRAALNPSAPGGAASPLPPLHKREFVLMPGCYVSDVRELPGAAGGKGRSLWEFRLHW